MRQATIVDRTANRRERRNRLRRAVREAERTLAYSREKTQGLVAAALADPAFPAAARDWATATAAAAADPNVGLTVNPPAFPSTFTAADIIACSTIADWAERCRMTGLVGPHLVAKLALAQGQLDIAIAANPEAPPDTPADDGEVEEETEGALVTMANHAEKEWRAFGSDARLRCGLPKVGHGVVGEPCQNVLGPDGLCQDHDK
jgi:hypothetical protein